MGHTPKLPRDYYTCENRAVDLIRKAEWKKPLKKATQQTRVIRFSLTGEYKLRLAALQLAPWEEDQMRVLENSRKGWEVSKRKQCTAAVCYTG